MEIPELLLLVMETSLVSLCMKIMSVLITVIQMCIRDRCNVIGIDVVAGSEMGTYGYI